MNGFFDVDLNCVGEFRQDVFNFLVNTFFM